jgi:hypothetical protein
LEPRHRLTRLIGIVATLAVAFAIASVHLYRPVAASGATLTVTGQGNEDPANGLCDLEEAVKAAVTDSNYNDCTASVYGDDTILLSGTVTLTNSLLVNGGGNLTLTGGGTIEWAGLPTVRLMWISGPLTVRIEGLTLRGNQNPGIHVEHATLEVIESTLESFATGTRGGAIRAQPAATVLVTRSIFRNNRAGVGGAISGFPANSYEGTVIQIDESTFEGNRGTFGGALAVMSSSVTITRSTFAGNTASQRGAAINAHTESEVVVLNSTFSGNAAPSGSVLSVANRTAAAVVFTTLADQQGGPALSAYQINSQDPGGSTIVLRNSLLADDSVDECLSTTLYSVTLSGTVLADDSSCGGSATTGLRATLDPLQNNGGFTSTHALLPGSPAIDAVPAAECTDHSGNPVSEDQRARPRPSPASGACDAGSFEIEQTEPASTPHDRPPHHDTRHTDTTDAHTDRQAHADTRHRRPRRPPRRHQRRHRRPHPRQLPRQPQRRRPRPRRVC